MEHLDKDTPRMYVCIIVTEKGDFGNPRIHTIFKLLEPSTATMIYVSGFMLLFRAYWEGGKIWIAKDNLQTVYDVPRLKAQGKPILPAPGNNDMFGGWVACSSSSLRTLSIWACSREVIYRSRKVA